MWALRNRLQSTLFWSSKQVSSRLALSSIWCSQSVTTEHLGPISLLTVVPKQRLPLFVPSRGSGLGFLTAWARPREQGLGRVLWASCPLRQWAPLQSAASPQLPTPPPTCGQYLGQSWGGVWPCSHPVPGSCREGDQALAEAAAQPALTGSVPGPYRAGWDRRGSVCSAGLCPGPVSTPRVFLKEGVQ